MSNEPPHRTDRTPAAPLYDPAFDGDDEGPSPTPFVASTVQV